MKQVLILGAGLMQQPAIDAAHELGYSVVVFDGNENSHCKSFCENFEVIDLKHTEKIVLRALEIHARSAFSAVFTAGTDFSFAVSSVASACNLPSHTVDAAKNASDKIAMRSCFKKDGVPSPEFIEVSESTDSKILENFVSDCDFPIVVKPCDNMGARGCRLARNDKELQEAIIDAISYSKTGRAIVEEYMEGPEFSIDALVYNNEVTITGFADRHIFYPPYFIEMGHSMPTDIDAQHKDSILKTFVQGIRSLGLSHGAAKADIKLTKNGPMVGEIAARLSGGYMSGWTFPYASGLNLTKQGLLIALNNSPQDLLEKRVKIFGDVSGFVVYDYPCNTHCIERAWLSIPGVIEDVTLAESSMLKNVFPRLQKGDSASFPVNNVQKAGNVISIGKTRKDALEYAESFIRGAFLPLKDSKDTIEFLQQDLQTEFPPSAFFLPKDVYKKVKNLPKEAIVSEVIIPDFLQEFVDVVDWNKRSLQETVNFVNEHITLNVSTIINSNVNTSLPNFWACLIRGGIQGALFYFL